MARNRPKYEMDTLFRAGIAKTVAYSNSLLVHPKLCGSFEYVPDDEGSAPSTARNPQL